MDNTKSNRDEIRFRSNAVCDEPINEYMKRLIETQDCE